MDNHKEPRVTQQAGAAELVEQIAEKMEQQHAWISNVAAANIVRGFAPAATTASASDVPCYGASRPGEMCPCLDCTAWRERVAKTMGRAPAPSQEAVLLLKQWKEAYAAFVGAFDTPQMRRRMPDEYSADARKRLREFSEAPAQQGAAQASASIRTLEFVNLMNAWRNADPLTGPAAYDAITAHIDAKLAAAQAAHAGVDAERLDWLNQNFFSDQKDEWDERLAPDSIKWKFFGPMSVQGDIRRVIDAAIAANTSPEKKA